MTKPSPDDGSETQVPGWPTCGVPETAGRCTGVRVDGYAECLAHLEPEQLDEVLARLHPFTDLDVRGTTLSPGLLETILDAVRGDDGSPNFHNALFDGVMFKGDAWFDGTFKGDASFSGATFRRGASFGTFKGDASFSGATFEDEVLFSEATFGGHASFSGVTFTSTSVVWFGGATFDGDAEFTAATFDGEIRFEGLTFKGDARFDGVRFAPADSFGPIIARKLTLAFTVFSRRMEIKVSATELDCDETRFEAGAVLRLRNARATFRYAVFAAPSVIIGGQPLMDIAEQKMGLDQGEPALSSLEGVDLADLVVTDIDLSQCRFAYAHHLDKLRLEGDCQFAWPPRRIQRGRRWPLVWRWTRRQVLAEECDLRAAGPKRAGWPTAPPFVTPLNPKRVAALYRDLRKAQEDSKNEPGAADFYYGEMEMRRTDSATPWPERLVLFLYWLVSGYGLRMARALVCLAVLVATALVALHVVGFAAPQPSLSTCLLYATESAVSLDPKLPGLPNLTWQGEIIRVIMRLLGPLLLGLALLAVRNRVKR